MKKLVILVFCISIVSLFALAGTAFSVQMRSRPKGMSDEKIKQDVVHQLAWDNSLDATKIAVEVADGKVILSGTVMTYSQRVSAAKDALDVKGVSALDNKLLVKISMGPNDDVLTKRVYNTLKWHSDIDFDTQNIDVEVSAGAVTLKGSVDNYWRKLKAENLVSGLSGVKRVTNELTVVPSDKISDEKIAEDVVEALERNASVRAERVTVEVKQNLVTLSGWVQDRKAYYAAQNSAVMTPGVIGVVNDLVVY